MYMCVCVHMFPGTVTVKVVSSVCYRKDENHGVLKQKQLRLVVHPFQYDTHKSPGLLACAI
jgi:hypothetical protein